MSIDADPFGLVSRLAGFRVEIYDAPAISAPTIISGISELPFGKKIEIPYFPSFIRLPIESPGPTQAPL